MRRHLGGRPRDDVLLGMWSIVTLMLFFVPHSRANLSNYVSNSGTKWLHWMIVSVFVCA